MPLGVNDGSLVMPKRPRWGATREQLENKCCQRHREKIRRNRRKLDLLWIVENNGQWPQSYQAEYPKQVNGCVGCVQCQSVCERVCVGRGSTPGRARTMKAVNPSARLQTRLNLGPGGERWTALPILEKRPIKRKEAAPTTTQPRRQPSNQTKTKQHPNQTPLSTRQLGKVCEVQSSRGDRKQVKHQLCVTFNPTYGGGVTKLALELDKRKFWKLLPDTLAKIKPNPGQNKI